MQAAKFDWLDISTFPTPFTILYYVITLTKVKGTTFIL
jgi:hypothetical protein